MVTPEVKTLVEAKIESCLEIARKAFDREFITPIVTYDVTGRVAGYAYDHLYKVSFNPVLLMENVEDFIERTVPHEVAHLVDGRVYPETRMAGFGKKRSIHGPTWKSIMVLFGAPTSRCHSYDTKSVARNTKKFTWVCRNCGKHMALGPKRHRRQMERGGLYYFLNSCRPHKASGYTFNSKDISGGEKTLRRAAMKTEPTKVPNFEGMQNVNVNELPRALKKKVVGSKIAELREKNLDNSDIVKALTEHLSLSYHNARYYVFKVFA